MNIDSDNILHGPQVDEPRITTSLGEFFWNQLVKHGDRQAQIEQIAGVEVVLTYAEVFRKARRIGQLLVDNGIREGDTVLLCCANSLDYLPVMVATQFVGACLAAIDPALRNDDMVHLLSVISPQLVITNKEARSQMLSALAASRSASSAEVVHVAIETLPGGGISGPLPELQPAKIADPYSHVAFVMCSSGTSGRPKGVELTPASCLTQINAQQYLWAGVPKEFQMVALNLSGPYWVSCLMLQITCLAAGAKVALLPHFSVENYLAHIEKYKVNLSLLSPDKMIALAKHDTTRRYDVSSLRLVTCGGNPVSQAVIRQVEAKLGMRILPFYAMTEATGVVRVAVGVADQPGSVGVLFDNVKCKTVDPETGKNLPAKAEGELCFHTATVMKGYRGNEEATRAAFDNDGFLHTGDIGYFDANGFIYVVDRLKELIKYRGNHVPAVELEDVLMTHEDVMEAAVVGIGNAEGWEDATAFVVRRPGSHLTQLTLVDLIKDKLPQPKWLHGGVRFIDELPKTATGKTKKRDLRAMELAAQGKP